MAGQWKSTKANTVSFLSYFKLVFLYFVSFCSLISATVECYSTQLCNKCKYKVLYVSVNVSVKAVKCDFSFAKGAWSLWPDSRNSVTRQTSWGEKFFNLN